MEPLTRAVLTFVVLVAWVVVTLVERSDDGKT
jgi:hypothetical protein